MVTWLILGVYFGGVIPAWRKATYVVGWFFWEEDHYWERGDKRPERLPTGFALAGFALGFVLAWGWPVLWPVRAGLRLERKRGVPGTALHWFMSGPKPSKQERLQKRIEELEREVLDRK